MTSPEIYQHVMDAEKATEELRKASEQAWDEGYEQGLETQYGSPTPGGYPRDPDANPYCVDREESV